MIPAIPPLIIFGSNANCFCCVGTAVVEEEVELLSVVEVMSANENNIHVTKMFRNTPDFQYGSYLFDLDVTTTKHFQEKLADV